MKTIPDPSLCDNCRNAYKIEGGSSGVTDSKGFVYDCPQRYCSVFHIAIHFGGKQECKCFISKGGENEES